MKHRILLIAAVTTAVGCVSGVANAASSPAVQTGSASSVKDTSATLTGTVNPNGAATTWVFQYGLTTAYGVQTFGGILSASSSPSTITEQLSGIAPGTVFHYRLVAVHGNAVTDGADLTFFTLPSPRPVPSVNASTTPSRARHKPYVFTASGHVGLPASIPAALGCNGNATVVFFRGKQQVGFGLANLQPNCTFVTQVSFGHLLGKHGSRLKVIIHFRGNPYLAPSNASTEHVQLG